MSSGTVTLLIPERSGARDRGFDAFAGGCNGDYGFRQVTAEAISTSTSTRARLAVTSCWR